LSNNFITCHIVTLYVNYIDSKLTSFEDFVNKEIEESKNDSKTSIIESSNILINNKPAAKLVDSEYEGYKFDIHLMSEFYVAYAMFNNFF
jgi:hypothetical protein